ncbi:MAG: ComF family protein [Peptococcaceae bacterium]|nr:ComF family protein [Peptococcaceae bacterium]
MWREFLSILFPNPSMCILCEERAEALTICADCLARYARYADGEGQCQRCGHFGTRAPVCDVCRDWPRYFLGNTALFPYDDSVREMILRFKFHDEPWRVEGVATVVEQMPAPAVSAIVPVPLHPARLRERGYNQSLLLARVLGQAWQIPVLDTVLRRTVNTRHQVGLSRSERQQNVAGAFSVPDAQREKISGQRLLLVDDVMTTGSTLLSCARTLHSAGAKEILSLTLAAGT